MGSRESGQKFLGTLNTWYRSCSCGLLEAVVEVDVVALGALARFGLRNENIVVGDWGHVRLDSSAAVVDRMRGRYAISDASTLVPNHNR